VLIGFIWLPMATKWLSLGNIVRASFLFHKSREYLHMLSDSRRQCLMELVKILPDVILLCVDMKLCFLICVSKIKTEGV
jgi:hypothetical protein